METMQTMTVKIAKTFDSIETNVVIGAPNLPSDKFTKIKSNDFGDLGELEYVVACDDTHTSINIKPDNLFGIIGIISKICGTVNRTLMLSDGPLDWWEVNPKLTVILHNGVIAVVQYR